MHDVACEFASAVTMRSSNGQKSPLRYRLFDSFNICFHIEIYHKLFSDVTKVSTCPGNDSQLLSCPSLARVPTENQIHFAVKRLDDTKVKQQIAGDILYRNQKLFHHLILNLRFACCGALKNKLREVIGI